MSEIKSPAREPKWPVSFTVGVKNRVQAEMLVRCLIHVERALRRPIRRGDFRNMYLADSIAVARRKLQEDAGLVATAAEVEAMVRRNQEQVAEGYRSKKLTRDDVSRILGLPWADIEEFLRKHGCEPHYPDAEQHSPNVDTIERDSEREKSNKQNH
jgi:hypothetical protein